MGYYEPQWSAEEQAMIDLMELSGYKVGADIDRNCTVVALFSANTPDTMFKADTEYEAIRKAFNYWTKHNA